MRVKIKKEDRIRRHRRVRAKIYGTAGAPRLCVFRSAKHIYAQLIDDEKGKTLAAASDLELKAKSPAFAKASAGKQKSKTEEVRTMKTAVASEVGKLIAKKALEKKIEKVVFDRGGCKYHGRIKALAEGAREAGLKF